MQSSQCVGQTQLEEGYETERATHTRAAPRALCTQHIVCAAGAPVATAPVGDCTALLPSVELIRGFSAFEVVWIFLELGFYVDQRHQSITSGAAARWEYSQCACVQGHTRREYVSYRRGKCRRSASPCAVEPDEPRYLRTGEQSGRSARSAPCAEHLRTANRHSK